MHYADVVVAHVVGVSLEPAFGGLKLVLNTSARQAVSFDGQAFQGFCVGCSRWQTAPDYAGACACVDLGLVPRWPLGRRHDDRAASVPNVP